MLQNRRRSNGADNDEEGISPNTTTAGTNSVISIFGEDMLVYDILSRIPAKSLMRFKCVSKPWCSLIRDPYFVDLHFTRSKTLQRFFIIIPQVRSETANEIEAIYFPQLVSETENEIEAIYFPQVGSETENEIEAICSPQVGSEMENEIEGIYYQSYPAYFKTTGLLSEESGRVASTIPTARNLRSAKCTDIIGGVNGLICFVNNFTHDDRDNAACVFNISTGEITPWIISTVLKEAREDKTCCYIGAPTYCFGYDPASKKHKVMCMWDMSRQQDDGTIVNGPVCEVLTVGHNSWRKIEAAPPHHFDRTVCSVYVNGSVYWFPGVFECDDWNNGNDVFMVAFDVGSEKFRTIQISKFRSGDPNPVLDRCYLLEVDGCVAILRRVTADTADIWIYEDSDKESTYKATTMDSTDWSWTKNTITLPVGWVDERDFYFHTPTGTDEIIMETHGRNSDRRSKAVAIYSYDLKKMFFKEIEISGIPSSIPVCFDTRLCTSFCDSLVSLSEA